MNNKHFKILKQQITNLVVSYFDSKDHWVRQFEEEQLSSVDSFESLSNLVYQDINYCKKIKLLIPILDNQEPFVYFNFIIKKQNKQTIFEYKWKIKQRTWKKEENKFYETNNLTKIANFISKIQTLVNSPIPDKKG